MMIVDGFFNLTLNLSFMGLTDIPLNVETIATSLVAIGAGVSITPSKIVNVVCTVCDADKDDLTYIPQLGGLQSGFDRSSGFR